MLGGAGFLPSTISNAFTDCTLPAVHPGTVTVRQQLCHACRCEQVMKVNLQKLKKPTASVIVIPSNLLGRSIDG